MKLSKIGIVCFITFLGVIIISYNWKVCCNSIGLRLNAPSPPTSFQRDSRKDEAEITERPDASVHDHSISERDENSNFIDIVGIGEKEPWAGDPRIAGKWKDSDAKWKDSDANGKDSDANGKELLFEIVGKELQLLKGDEIWSGFMGAEIFSIDSSGIAKTIKGQILYLNYHGERENKEVDELDISFDNPLNGEFCSCTLHREK